MNVASGPPLCSRTSSTPVCASATQSWSRACTTTAFRPSGTTTSVSVIASASTAMLSPLSHVVPEREAAQIRVSGAGGRACVDEVTELLVVHDADPRPLVDRKRTVVRAGPYRVPGDGRADARVEADARKRERHRAGPIVLSPHPHG